MHYETPYYNRIIDKNRVENLGIIYQRKKTFSYIQSNPVDRFSG